MDNIIMTHLIGKNVTIEFTEYENLIKENNELKTVNNNLKIENNNLKNSSDILRQNQITNLLTIELLQKQNKELIEDNGQLRKEIEKIKEENKQLKEENEQLKESINNLKDKVTELNYENKQQKEEIKELKEENKQLKEEIKELKEENKQLKEEIKELKSEIKELKEYNKNSENKKYIKKLVIVCQDLNSEETLEKVFKHPLNSLMSKVRLGRNDDCHLFLKTDDKRTILCKEKILYDILIELSEDRRKMLNKKIGSELVDEIINFLGSKCYDSILDIVDDYKEEVDEWFDE